MHEELGHAVYNERLCVSHVITTWLNLTTIDFLDNVQKVNNFVNIPLSQTFRFYSLFCLLLSFLETEYTRF
jgi:hypothetical protein